MKRQTNDTLPLVGDRQIIIGSRGENSQLHNFNVVRYYEPMKVYYAGPGMYINPKNIDFWAEIPAPPATK